jgi:hypothetical protein
MLYRIVEARGARGPWRVRTALWDYSILDDDGKDLLSFHWHPGSKVQTPHVHLGTAALKRGLALSKKAHIPTGRVSLEEVLPVIVERFHAEFDAPDRPKPTVSEREGPSHQEIRSTGLLLPSGN